MTWLKRFVLFVPLSLGLTSEERMVSIQLMEGFIEHEDAPVTSARISVDGVDAAKLQVLRAKLTIMAKLTGLRYLLYEWPVASMVFSVTVLVTLQLLITLVAGLLLTAVVHKCGPLPGGEAEQDQECRVGERDEGDRGDEGEGEEEGDGAVDEDWGALRIPPFKKIPPLESISSPGEGRRVGSGSGGGETAEELEVEGGTHAHIHTQTHTHTDTYLQTYIGTHVQTHTYTRTCTNVNTYTQTHTHTHTHARLLRW
jgi:hypothetical protein